MERNQEYLGQSDDDGGMVANHIGGRGFVQWGRTGEIEVRERFDIEIGEI